MIYLDRQVESLLKYSAIDKQKISEYKQAISIQDNSIQQLSKSLQETQGFLIEEERKKKMWRRLCLIPSGIIIGAIALSL
jgi:flagellar biosynthesis chaperone FliJ